MKGIKLETLRTITRLIKASSKDETRAPLMGVNVRPLYNDKVIIEATTGFYANQTTVVDDSFNTFLQEHFSNGLIISKDNEKALKLALKEYKKASPDTEFNIDSNLVISLSGCMVIQLKKVHIEYVKLDQVMGNNKKSDNDFKISFNLDYLKNLVDSMDNVNKTKVIQFNLNKDTILGNDTCVMKPILVTNSSDVNQKAVLMPCKI